MKCNGVLRRDLRVSFALLLEQPCHDAHALRTIQIGPGGSGIVSADLHRYIEFNPVRANRVEQPQDYRWSSYASHALDKPDDFKAARRLALRYLRMNGVMNYRMLNRLSSFQSGETWAGIAGGGLAAFYFSPVYASGNISAGLGWFAGRQYGLRRTVIDLLVGRGCLPYGAMRPVRESDRVAQ